MPPDDPRETGTGDGAINFWPLIAKAYQEVGRDGDALAAVLEIEAASVAAGRTWPFTSGHAGEILFVLS